MNEKELAKRLNRMGEKYLSLVESNQQSRKARESERNFYLEECLRTREAEDLVETKQRLSASIIKYWTSTFISWRDQLITMHILEAMALEKNEPEVRDEINKYSKKSLRVEQFVDLQLCTYHFQVLQEIYILESVNSFNASDLQKFELFLSNNEILDEDIDESAMRSFLTLDQMTSLHYELNNYYFELIDLAVTKLSVYGNHFKDDPNIDIAKEAIEILFQSCGSGADDQMASSKDLLRDLLHR